MRIFIDLSKIPNVKVYKVFGFIVHIHFIHKYSEYVGHGHGC